MKQQNYVFVEIVSSIFLLILLIGNFLGLLYITEGNIVMSLLGSMFLVVCYFFVLELLKKNKEEMVKKKFIHLSSVFWFFLLLLGFVSYSLMSHFINIEYQVKPLIQKEASTKIKLVDDFARLYSSRSKNDIQDFESKLDSLLSKFKESQSPSVKTLLISSPYYLEPKLLANPEFINSREIVAAKTTPMYAKVGTNIKNIDSTIVLNSKKYQSVFDNWKRLSLIGSYNKLNQYVTNSLTYVNSKIKELPVDKTEINISFDQNQLPLNSPIELNKQFPPDMKLPLMIIVIIHLFILIPFLFKKIKVYPPPSERDHLEIENVREI
jgi:hypothetical protein